MSRSRVVAPIPPAGDLQELEQQGRQVARRVARLRAKLTAALAERDDVADALITAGLSLAQTGRIVGGLCKERTRRAVNARRASRQAEATAGAA